VKVLVAHTDVALRRDTRLILERHDHRVREAETTSDALELCRAEHPDVLLMEDAMADGPRLGLLDAIKRDVEIFRIAVTVLGSGLPVERVSDLLQRGAHDVLGVPVDPAELLARVRAAERTKVLQEVLTAQSERLERLIYGDELTGLFNRRFLLAQLAALVSGARRHERPMSVVMIDIDHFKRVNDEHGHAAGDAVLAAVADTLRERLRAEDWIGRLGGEEFLVLLPTTTPKGPPWSPRACATPSSTSACATWTTCCASPSASDGPRSRATRTPIR
jgi:PleD family two-component response regulator